MFQWSVAVTKLHLRSIHEIISHSIPYKHNFIRPLPIDQLVMKYSGTFHTKTNDGVQACLDVTAEC